MVNNTFRIVALKFDLSGEQVDGTLRSWMRSIAHLNKHVMRFAENYGKHSAIRNQQVAKNASLDCELLRSAARQVTAERWAI